MALEISISEPKAVMRHCYYPHLTRLRDDTLIVTSIRRSGPRLSDRRDEKTMVCDSVLSRDGGETWEPCLPGSSSMTQLRDGTVISIGYRTTCGYLKPQELYQGKANPPGEFETLVRCSHDGWKTVTFPIVAPVHVPEASTGYDDMGFPSYGPVFYHSIVELEDGSLLASMYGKLTGADVPIPGAMPEMRQRKNSCWVVKSTDRGRTWSYLSTIGSNPDIAREGFDEPVMERLANGDILCVMRTGGPLYQSRSVVQGRTWSAPITVGVQGVDPDMCLMSNGVLACSYGRPGNRIMFSEDGTGRWWSHHTDIYSGRFTSGYTCIAEVAPGELLYLYDYDPRIAAAEGIGEPEGALKSVIIKVGKVEG